MHFLEQGRESSEEHVLKENNSKGYLTKLDWTW